MQIRRNIKTITYEIKGLKGQYTIPQVAAHHNVFHVFGTFDATRNIPPYIFVQKRKSVTF